MTFDKTVISIIEEVRPKPKYQLLSPDNYTDILLVQTHGVYWGKLDLVSGWEIRQYGSKQDIVNVNDRVETLYIVNDSSDLPDWDLLDSYYQAYGKPSAIEETSDDVKDVFGDVYGEL